MIRKHSDDLFHWCPISDPEPLLEALDAIARLEPSDVPDHWHSYHARKKKTHHLNGACFGAAPMYSTLINSQAVPAAQENWQRLMFLVWGSAVSIVRNIESGEAISHRLLQREQLDLQSPLFKQTSSRFYHAISNSSKGLRLLSEAPYSQVVEDLGNALGAGGRESDLAALSGLDLKAYEIGAFKFESAVRNLVKLGGEFDADPIKRSDRNRAGWETLGHGISICGHVRGRYRTFALNSGWGHQPDSDKSQGEDSQSFDVGGWDRSGFQRDQRDAIATEYASGSGIIVDFPRNASAFLDEGQAENGGRRSTSITSVFGAIARHRAIARNNQAFHWAWKELSGAEQAFVQNLLARAGDNLDSCPNDLVVNVASVFSLGRPTRALRNAMVTHSSNPPGSQLIEYVLDLQLWRIKILPPAYTSMVIEEDDEENPAVYQTSDRVLLPDLFGIHRFIAPLVPQNTDADAPSGGRLKKPFKTANLLPRGRKRIRELERMFNEITPKHMRLGVDRLAHPLRSQLLQRSRDAAVAAILCDDNSLHGQTLRHYNTMLVTDVQAHYEEAAKSVLGVASRKPPKVATDEIRRINDVGFRTHVGSKLLPRTEYVQSVVANLKRTLAENSQQNSEQSVRIFSNTQTLYLGLWMTTALALRARIDPWPCSVDLDRQIAVVNDKEKFEGFGVRLGYLPGGLCQQIRFHQRHRKRLALNSGADPSQLEQLGFPNLPVILERSRSEIVALRPSMFTDLIGLQFPINSMRRYTRTYLKTAGAPGEWIDAYLGHWQNGMSPYDRYASMSPMDIQQELRPLLDDMLDALGFEPVV
ncbi:hypothetical protein GYB61_08260 [bacterium]|nr:hypothetical protein [bacterium]